MRIRLERTLLAYQFLCCAMSAMTPGSDEGRGFRSFPPEVRAQCQRSFEKPLPEEANTNP